MGEEGGDVGQLVVISEFHVTVLIPRDLPDAQAEAIRRVLERQAIVAVCCEEVVATVPSGG
jgi:hypothetical protein